MKPLKKVPIPPEEEIEICKKCGGFCCKYYFFNPGESLENIKLHEFREREIIKYGVSNYVIFTDRCPYTSDELHVCTRRDDPKYPTLCKKFPESYRPFWNLRCKLMRARYARRLIPKDVEGFAKLRKACKPNESVMKVYKPK